MATYTAVLVVPNELEQEYVQEQLERLGVLAFMGPGSLISEDAISDEEITVAEREGAGPEGVMAVQERVARTLVFEGLKVSVSIENTPDGPCMRIGGVNCDLSGEMPGEYYLTPR